MDTETIRAATKGCKLEDLMNEVANLIDQGRGWCADKQDEPQHFYFRDLYEDEKKTFLALAFMCPSNVIALVTHDLRSAEIKHMGRLIDYVRIGDEWSN